MLQPFVRFVAMLSHWEVEEKLNIINIHVCGLNEKAPSILALSLAQRLETAFLCCILQISRIQKTTRWWKVATYCNLAMLGGENDTHVLV